MAIEIFVGIDLDGKIAQVYNGDEEQDVSLSIEDSADLSYWGTLSLLKKEIDQKIEKFDGEVEVVRYGITVKKFEKGKLLEIVKNMKELGVEREKLVLVSYEESFATYVFNMDKELYSGGVLLLDYDENGISAIKMSAINKKGKEIITESRDFCEDEKILKALYAFKGIYSIERELVEIAKQSMAGKVISSVYLTGKGFDVPKLPDEFVKYICNRRRVFSGDNLYAKGAYLAAIEEYEEDSQRVYACANRISTQIDMKISEFGKDKIFRVIRPGANWFQARRTLELIVDNTTEIEFLLSSIIANGTVSEKIDISEIPLREDKTTRIKVDFSFDTENKCIVKIEDMGFGDFVKPSGVSVEKEFRV